MEGLTPWVYEIDDEYGIGSKKWLLEIVSGLAALLASLRLNAPTSLAN
jgi:hypothetical protein